MESTRQRLRNLLIILLEAIASGEEDVWLDRQRFQDLVAAAGYDDSDIDGVLDWLEDQWLPVARGAWPATGAERMSDSRGVRLFGEDEREFLTPDAFGYLLSLRRAGQITHQQMETLIHYASLVSLLPLERQEVDQLLERVLFSPPGRDPLGPPAAGLGKAH